MGSLPWHSPLYSTRMFPSQTFNPLSLAKLAWDLPGLLLCVCALSHSHPSVLMKYGMKDRRTWRLGTFSCFFLTSSRSLRKSYWTCQWMLQRDLLVVSETDLEILCRTAMSAAAQPHVLHTTPFIDLTYSQLLFPASVPRANDYLGSRKLILP